MTRLILALTALLVAAPLHAQQNAPAANASQLRVVVVDETGAGIPAATVVVIPEGGQPVEFLADERGLATSPALPVVSRHNQTLILSAVRSASPCARRPASKKSCFGLSPRL